LDARRFSDRSAVSDLEELAFSEAESTREQVVREHLDLGVELAHAPVVETTGCLDLVFSVDERVLHLTEVLTRLQLRVGLSDREQALERLLHVSLCDAGFTRACRGERLSTSTRHILENGLLMGGIALHRLDEVGDQICTTLQLYRDAAPRLV